jgi:hypothetical protein
MAFSATSRLCGLLVKAIRQLTCVHHSVGHDNVETFYSGAGRCCCGIPTRRAQCSRRFTRNISAVKV